MWGYDLTEDRTERNGRLRSFNAVDKYARQCQHIRVDRSIGVAKVIAPLEWLFLLHGTPHYIRSYNDTELIAKTLSIPPGSPRENACIQCYNDKLRATNGTK